MHLVMKISDHPKYRQVRRIEKAYNESEFKELISDRDNRIADDLDRIIAYMENHNDQQFRDTRSAYDDLAHRTAVILSIISRLTDDVCRYEKQDTPMFESDSLF